MDPATYEEERHPQLGATDSERDRTEMLLTRWAIEGGMPVLGVCRGVQVINVVCGGTLYQDLLSQQSAYHKHDFFPPNHERYRISHQIKIEPDSRLAHALGSVHEVKSCPLWWGCSGIPKNWQRPIPTVPDSSIILSPPLPANGVPKFLPVGNNTLWKSVPGSELCNRPKR